MNISNGRGNGIRRGYRGGSCSVQWSGNGIRIYRRVDIALNNCGKSPHGIWTQFHLQTAQRVDM